jgi:preprotein translocase subunit SecD
MPGDLLAKSLAIGLASVLNHCCGSSKEWSQGPGLTLESNCVQCQGPDTGENTEPLTNNAGGQTLHVQKTPLLDYTAIRSATVTTNMSSGAPQIDIEFSEVGKELFAAITKENINKRLAIVLDGQLFSAPVIRSEISEGKAQITGSFTEEEARELAAKINDAISGK